jgi:hypothetical protein
MQWTASYYGQRLMVAAQVYGDRQLPPPLKPVIVAMVNAPTGIAESSDMVRVYTSGSASQLRGTDAWVFRDLRLTLECGDKTKPRATLKAWAR